MGSMPRKVASSFRLLLWRLRWAFIGHSSHESWAVELRVNWSILGITSIAWKVGESLEIK